LNTFPASIHYRLKARTIKVALKGEALNPFFW
jgi:hypothetical protein